MSNTQHRLFHLNLTTILLDVSLNKHLLNNAYILSFKDTEIKRTCCLLPQASEGNRLNKLAVTVNVLIAGHGDLGRAHRAGANVECLKELKI